MEQAIYTVTQLNQYLKQKMDEDPALIQIFVRGELSNYKIYPSGHHYFSLKDADGALRCVMFRREAGRLRFRPENGQKVIAFGRVTVFPRDGQYQLYCGDLEPDGIGELYLAFEQLKEKLYREGLFDPGHKKPIPAYPERIALITSPSGAAVQDMLRILSARWPLAQVFLVPVRVQGEQAPGELCAALDYVSRAGLADLVIVGRGGGSMEDLWAFNDEQVARAIYRCSIPVISAVGHEPDVTIADYVADLRAATPSNAAELAVPDQNEIYDRIRAMSRRLEHAAESRLEEGRGRLERLTRNRNLSLPLDGIQERRMLLDYQQQRLVHALTGALSREKERFAHLAASLDALSPLKVLGRGYAMAQTESGETLRSIRQIEVGQRLHLSLSDGALSCQVEKKEGRRN